MDKVILFNLNEKTFGIEVNYVKEVLEAGYIKPVPLTPPFISGLLNRRGKLLTIVQLALLLGLSPGVVNQDFRIIVLDYKEMDIGILVDKVVGTKSVHLNDKDKRTENIMGDDGKNFIKMVLKNVGAIDKVTVLNVEGFSSFLLDYKP